LFLSKNITDLARPGGYPRANQLFLKNWPYFCVNHIGTTKTNGWGRVRHVTATERRGRSILVIAALSALCWAVLIGLGVALSYFF
jgi:hypothetical protein